MAAFDQIKLLRLKKTLTLHSHHFYRTPSVTASEQTQEISLVHLAKRFFD